MTKNYNASIRAKSEYWDSKIVEITDLVQLLGYRLKDLAAHFDCSVTAITTVLHRRDISVVALRHQFKKGS